MLNPARVALSNKPGMSELGWFDADQLPPCGVMLCSGSIRTGKSTFAHALVRAMRHRSDHFVFAGLDAVYQADARWLRNKKVERIPENIYGALQRVTQSKVEERMPRQHTVILLDQDDPREYCPDRLFLDAHHLNITLVITTWSTTYTTPMHLSWITRLFAFPTANKDLARLWQDNFGITFTPDHPRYECLVWQDRQPKQLLRCNATALNKAESRKRGQQHAAREVENATRHLMSDLFSALFNKTSTMEHDGSQSVVQSTKPPM